MRLPCCHLGGHHAGSLLPFNMLQHPAGLGSARVAIRTAPHSLMRGGSAAGAAPGAAAAAAAGPPAQQPARRRARGAAGGGCTVPAYPAWGPPARQLDA